MNRNTNIDCQLCARNGLGAGDTGGAEDREVTYRQEYLYLVR